MKRKQDTPKFKRIYTTDDCAHHTWVRQFAAKKPVDFVLTFDMGFINASKKGVPWKCLLANGTRYIAGHNPKLFPHPVVDAYVEGSNIWIYTRTQTGRAKQFPTAVFYRHNFSKTLRQFDTMTKAQFIELFGEKGVSIRLRPPRRQHGSGTRTVSRPQPARHPTEHERGEKRLVGAHLRAKRAGLLTPFMTTDGPAPTAA